MITTTIQVNKSTDWVKDQLGNLNADPDAALSNLLKQEPFLLLRKEKNFFTSICNAMVFIKPEQDHLQRVRIIFLPGFLLFGLIFCLLMSISCSVKSYLGYLHSQEYAQIHHVVRPPHFSPFPWAHIPGITMLIFFLLTAQKQTVPIFEHIKSRLQVSD